MSDVKWGMAIKIRKGLRIVQRHTAGGMVWYREERQDGRPVRVSLETSDEREAMRKAIAGPEAPAPAVFRPKNAGAAAAVTLEKVYSAYEEYYGKKNKASSLEVMKPTVWAFVEEIGTDADPRVITRDDIEALIEGYDDHSPSYVKNEYVRVGAFLRWVARKYKGAVDLSCLDVDNLPRDDSAGREIPDLTTAKAALRKLGGHDWLGQYVTVLFETGMRPSELLAVRGVDLNANLLSIEPWGSWSPKSKWSKRVIQLNEAATKILEERKKGLFDKRAPLFGLADGKMRSVKHVSKQYRDFLGDDKAFELCNLYVWKHLFCSEHAAPGPAFMELQTLAAYIGHAPGSTRVLERWYANRNAMRRGAPPALTIEAKDGKVIELKQAKS